MRQLPKGKRKTMFRILGAMLCGSSYSKIAAGLDGKINFLLFFLTGKLGFKKKRRKNVKEFSQTD